MESRRVGRQESVQAGSLRHVNAGIAFLVFVVIVSDRHRLRVVGVGVETLEEQYPEVLEVVVVDVRGEGGDVDRVRFRAERHVEVPEVLVGQQTLDLQFCVVTFGDLKPRLRKLLM